MTRSQENSSDPFIGPFMTAILWPWLTPDEGVVPLNLVALVGKHPLSDRSGLLLACRGNGKIRSLLLGGSPDPLDGNVKQRPDGSNFQELRIRNGCISGRRVTA